MSEDEDEEELASANASTQQRSNKSKSSSKSSKKRKASSKQGNAGSSKSKKSKSSSTNKKPAAHTRKVGSQECGIQYHSTTSGDKREHGCKCCCLGKQQGSCRISRQRSQSSGYGVRDRRCHNQQQLPQFFCGIVSLSEQSLGTRVRHRGQLHSTKTHPWWPRRAYRHVSQAQRRNRSCR